MHLDFSIMKDCHRIKKNNYIVIVRKSCQGFADMIKGCGMIELPSVGNDFTWTGRRYKQWI